jgi:hypothetical protein
MKPNTQRRIRIASALTYLTVPTSIAWAMEELTRVFSGIQDPQIHKTLTIIPQPVAKVDSSYVHLAEFFAASGSCHEKLEEGIFDVAMTPC